MKKPISFLLIFMTTLLVACSGGETETPTPEPTEEPAAAAEPTEEPTAVPEAAPETMEEAEITGSIFYRERIALPDDAVVSVQLQDTSLADAPATVLGEQSYVTGGQQVPLPFAVSYNPADIEENHRYTLSVRITDAEGNLLFVNDTAIPVITQGNPSSDVEVNVIAIGGDIPAEVAQVTGTIVYQEDITLPDDATVTVQLQDTSLADAPATVLGEQSYVTEGQQIPLPFAVSYNPADIEENHQYSLSVRITDAEGNLLFINDTAVLVITRGNPTSDIEVQVVSTAAPEAGTAEEMADDSIFNKTWQWVRFTDPAVGPQEIEQPQRYELILNDDGTANIKADCNRVSATYTIDGGNISFTLGPTTLAACPSDSLADDYLNNLEAAAIWFTQDGDLFFDLMFDSGTMQFSETSTEDLENMLIGPVWEWSDFREANVTTAVPDIGAYSIQFLPDGIATIKADCNNILAAYSLEEDELTLQLGPTTMVFCGEESLDQQFTAGLNDAGAVSFDDQGFLRLALNSEDSELFFSPGGEQVTGTVTYLQRSALPEDAVLQVTLQDVSLADAPAIVIGAQIYRTDGAQVPLPYTVYYQPEIIQEGRTYTVAARITDADGNLLFINDTSTPVINNGETTDVEILVVPTN